MWLGKLEHATVESLHKAATSKVGAAKVGKIHGVVKTGGEGGSEAEGPPGRSSGEGRRGGEQAVTAFLSEHEWRVCVSLYSLRALSV